MCGIVGYVGQRQACPIIIKGLHRLEYRGYDSAGVALIGKDGQIDLYKCKGKVDDLEHFLEGKDTSSTIGIGHTRWATHGEPNDANAHPHFSQSGRLALIHNGIIENFRVLKDETRKLLKELDHKYLNELEAFRDMSPSSENIARYLFERLEKALAAWPVEVERVGVWESGRARAEYTRD